MNQQPIEKRIQKSDGEYLDVHSIFYTIQGEGPFAGTPCVFVRLAGCNLQCPQCDTEYTFGRCMKHIEDIRIEIERLTINARKLVSIQERGALVVITGGEPFRQPLGSFLRSLLRHRYWVQIESNGTLDAPRDTEYNLDISKREGAYIVCSPKTPKISEHILANACCFKYVLNYSEIDSTDGLPTRVLGNPTGSRVARPRAGALVYLQPADCGEIRMVGPDNSPKILPHPNNSRNLQAVMKSCLIHGHILQLQLHKILGVE